MKSTTLAACSELKKPDEGDSEITTSCNFCINCEIYVQEVYSLSKQHSFSNTLTS